MANFFLTKMQWMPFHFERIIFSTNGAGNPGYPYGYTPHAIYINWLSVRAEIIKLLEENTGQIFMTWIRQWTLRYDTKNKTSKRKKKKLEYLDFNRTNFCASKDAIKKWKKTTFRMKDSICKNPEYRKNSYNSTRKKKITRF